MAKDRNWVQHGDGIILKGYDIVIKAHGLPGLTSYSTGTLYVHGDNGGTYNTVKGAKAVGERIADEMDAPPVGYGTPTLEKIVNFEPQMTRYEEDGTEPSILELITMYYAGMFPREEAKKYAYEYYRQLASEFPEVAND